MIPVYRTTHCPTCGAAITISVDLKSSDRWVVQQLKASLTRHRLTNCSRPDEPTKEAGK